MKKRQALHGIEQRERSDDVRADAWIDNEVVGCEFRDVRHGKRLRQLLEQLSGRVGATTPWACQDWANTKAAYRFFGNDRISEANILAGHFASTRERFAASSGFPVLVLHDTTEFSYRHEDTAPIGMLKKMPTSCGKPGPPRFHTRCGILMHSSLVTTREGLPLGLAAIKFWNRDKFHGANALKRRINPTRVPIEPRAGSWSIFAPPRTCQFGQQRSAGKTAHMARAGERSPVPSRSGILHTCGEFQQYPGFLSRKLLIINIDGGGWSLQRTALWAEFPANREKYREISEIRSKSLPE